MDWYLEKMEKAIMTAKESASDDSKVSLVGHSAGGWLARLYMSEFGIDDIALLLSLGTPHLPPPKGVPGVGDQTRGLLDYVNNVCPGSYFAPSVKYVCVAGRYLKGDRFFPAQVPRVASTGIGALFTEDDQQGLVTSSEKIDMVRGRNAVISDGKVNPGATTFQGRIVGQGYKQVCGQADVWGDGVVPEISAFLDGATNVSLDGVYHSPVGSKVPERPWYGSSGVLEQWVHYLCD